MFVEQHKTSSTLVFSQNFIKIGESISSELISKKNIFYFILFYFHQKSKAQRNVKIEYH